MKILEFTKTMMHIKNSNPIFKYGRFELLDDTEDVVIFRRVLQDESLICIVNRDRSTKDITINTNAHSIDVIYGDCEANLEDGSVKITKNQGDIGTIIHEK
jgi:glycosidase